MLAHLRTEAYPMYRQTFYPPHQWTDDENLTVEKNRQAIEDAKRRLI